MKNDSLLNLALLGLLHQKPMSGYDLRRIFATTAMDSFSDSPGAIYPALLRLERLGWVSGKDQVSSGRRKRHVFQVTTGGLNALKSWLREPLTREDVVRGKGKLMLRFAFTDQTLGAKCAMEFLRQYSRELSSYIPELQRYLDAHKSEMPCSGRLALECGIEECKARLQWAMTSIGIYERGEAQR